MAENARPEARSPERAGPAAARGVGRRWLYGLGPLLLLGGLLAAFLRFDPLGALRSPFPPLEELTIERVSFPAASEMIVHVVNGGPEPVTVAQVMVDDAFWEHEMDPGRTIPRLGRARIRLPYPWVDGEPLAVTLVSSTGVTFEHEVDVATLSPRAGPRFFAVFALLGAYAGVVPVLIGLLWAPFLGGIGRRWLDFFLSLTVGLLVFLGVDSLHEALEAATAVPSALRGTGIVVMGVAGSVLVLRASAAHRRSAGIERNAAAGRLRLATLIAAGIGLHNLGEGLAIGSAFAVGEIALGSFLVVGFALHNTTEGIGIVAPVAADRPGIRRLAILGAIAGLPTIAGTWIGGFAYTPALGALFLALGAGAIFEVVWELGRLVQGSEGGLFAPRNATGLAVGLGVMYATALLVVA
ncbi:MAG: ZIP family metal transporter [Gemmatimonadota bacterium]